MIEMNEEERLLDPQLAQLLAAQNSNMSLNSKRRSGNRKDPAQSYVAGYRQESHSQLQQDEEENTLLMQMDIE